MDLNPGNIMRRCLTLVLLSAIALTASLAIARPQQSESVASQSETVLATLADGRELAVGIENGRAHASFGTPGAKAVVLEPRHARIGHTATVLPDGRVLILGGVDAKGHLIKRAEWFDPDSGRFTVARDVKLEPRAGHAVSALADGRLLVTGGTKARGRAATSIELFDPRTGKREVLARRVKLEGTASQAVPLDDGRVILLGRYDAGARAYRSAELYAKDRVVQSLLGTSDEEVRQFPVDGLFALRAKNEEIEDSLRTLSMTLLGAGGVAPVEVFVSAEQDALYVRSRRELLPGSRYTLFVDRPSTERATDRSLASIGIATAKVQLEALDQSAGADRALRITAGQGSGANDTCAPSALCREHSSTEGGFWRPGRDSLDERWRINGSYPAEPDARLIEGREIPSGSTAIYGQILRIDDKPVAGVTVSIGAEHARTDADGVFVLTDLEPGRQVLLVDGSSANTADAEYAEFIVGVDVEKGAVKPVAHRLYLPRISASDKVRLPSPTTRETIVSHPEIPGLEIRIPPDTVIRDREGRALSEISIIPVPVDRAMFPLPASFPSFFMVSPAGITIQGLTPKAASGVRLVYPNYGGDAPGTEHDFWTYDPLEGWKVYGSGVVDEHGEHVEPHEHAGLHDHFGAGHALSGAPPGPEGAPPPDGCNAPGGGGPARAGDPVDCRTGLFLHSRTDFAIQDVAPLVFTRTYRPGDTASRPFGRGVMHNYGMYLLGPHANPVLVLPDGARIPFVYSDNTGNMHTSVWEHKASRSVFYGAKLTAPTLPGGGGEYWLITLKDGTRLEFLAYSGNPLTAIIDRFGNAVRISFNAGLVSKVTSPSGRFLSFTYNGSNRISSVKDSSGRDVTYAYDAAGLLETVTYPDATVERYTYDGSGRMLTVVDRRGNTMVTNVYDANGRVQQQTLADAGVYTFSYAVGAGNVVTQTDVTDPLNRVRRVIFHTSGYPQSDTYPLGDPLAETTTYERQSAGLVTARIDGMGRRTEYTHDGSGNVTSVTALAGTANAVTTTYTYTPDYNLIASVTDPLSRTTTYAYTQGCLAAITDPLSHTTNIACNAAGQPTSVTDPLNHTTTYGYLGYDLRTVTDALSRTTTYTADGLGRTVAVDDPLGNRTRTEYDTRDRVSRSIDPMGRATTFTYDGNDNFESLTDTHGGRTDYEFDGVNRRISRTDALLQPESWTWDKLGRTLSHTDRKNQTTSYAYDARGRRTLTTYHDASTAIYGYDTGNRLTSIVDSVSGSITRSYDGLDRLTQEQTPQGTVSYVYDAAGQRTGMTAAAQGPVSYDYDLGGRLTTLTQNGTSVTIAYDAADRRTLLTLQNGVSTSYAYDAADQLTALTYRNSGGTLLGDLTYGYDAAGRRTSRGGSWASESLPTTTSGSSTFDLNNRQTSIDGYAPSYDANGNLLSDGQPAPSGKTYAWDPRNRLTQIQQGAATLATFEYDAVGRRTRKTIAGTTTEFLYDEWNPVHEKVGSATRTLLTGLDIDEYFARDDVVGRTHFLSDALGSTVALTDSSQVVRQRYSYEPFGEVTQSDVTTGFTNAYQFTGRENDGTGLYYYRQRYYSSALKRFIAEDPLEFPDGPNLYEYVTGDPASLVDPTGESATAVGTTCLGLVLVDGPAPVGDVACVCLLVGASAVAAIAARKNNECPGEGCPGLSTFEATPPAPGTYNYKEHRTNKRKSNKGKHDKGKTRKKRDKRGGEKGDANRPY